MTTTPTLPLEYQQECRTLVLPLPPSANRYWRLWHGRILVSADARKYKADVLERATGGGMTPILGPVRVSLDVYRARKSGDLDNWVKVALDSLQKVAFENDSQVVQIIATRYDDPQNPRLEVTVWQA